MKKRFFIVDLAMFREKEPHLDQVEVKDEGKSVLVLTKA